MFLTSQVDPAGNALTFIYDSPYNRLVQVKDAINQTTTLYYDSDDQYKITSIEDPFHRVASFQYDEQGRLQKITDQIGMSSAFTYDTGDFITTMTTPYGMTSFSFGEVNSTSGARWLYVTDPNGEHEFVYSPDTNLGDYDAVQYQ